MKKARFTYWQDDDYYLGFLNDYPDYQTQAFSKEELVKNLKDLLIDLESGEVPYVRKVEELVLTGWKNTVLQAGRKEQDMRDAIVEKLGAIMCGPPESEAVVAYALVEIRKLLERDNKKGDFTTLTFFCDWVVHVKLSGTGARDALSKLDLRLANLDLNNPNNVGADGEIYRFISFEWLLQELSDFCREYKLPLKWVADPGSWRSCVKFYSQIVRDCPLDVTRTDRNTVYIQKVSLMTTDAQAPTPNVESLRLGWQFDLSDGNTFTQTGNFRHQATPAKQASRKPMTDELGF